MPGMDHILSKGFLATGGSVAYSQFMVVQQINAATGPLSTINQAQCQICPPSASAAAGEVLGVCQENLDAVKTATGKAIIGVAMQGNIKVIWDGVGTAALTGVVIPSGTTAGSVAFKATSTTFANFPVVGIPLTLPAAAGDLFDIMLAIGDRI